MNKEKVMKIVKDIDLKGHNLRSCIICIHNQILKNIIFHQKIAKAVLKKIKIVKHVFIIGRRREKKKMKETNELLAEFFKDVFNKDVFLPDNIDLYSVLSILEIDMFKDWCNEKTIYIQ